MIQNLIRNAFPLSCFQLPRVATHGAHGDVSSSNRPIATGWNGFSEVEGLVPGTQKEQTEHWVAARVLGQRAGISRWSFSSCLRRVVSCLVHRLGLHGCMRPKGLSAVPTVWPAAFRATARTTVAPAGSGGVT